MDTYKENKISKTEKLVFGLSIVGFLLATFSMATNPDHVRPIVPDSICLLILMAPLLILPSKGPFKFTHTPLLTVALVLLFILLIRGIIAVNNPLGNLHTCSAAGSMLYQVECILYSSVTGQASIRIILPHFFALFIAATGVLISLRINNLRGLLTAIASASILLCLATDLLAKFEFSRDLYINLLTPREKGDFTRFHGPFSNVGWLWPFLSPSVAIMFWLGFSGKKTGHKVIGCIGILISAYVLITNGQRGALATLGICFFVSILWKVSGFINLQKSKKLIIASMILSSLILFAWIYNAAITMLTSTEPRIELWKLGYKLFTQSPLLGHGHASWYHLSKAMADSGEFRWFFESAHNLYLQTVVELGFLHSILIFAFIALTIHSMKLSLKKSTGNNLLFALLLGCFLLITNVQEIDHVRAVYYLWALITGLCLAFGGIFHIQQNFPRYSAIAALSSFIVLCLTCLFIFPSGMYAFEPLPEHVPWPKLERWSKEQFELNYLNKVRKEKASTTFPVRLDVVNEKDQIKVGDHPPLTGLKPGDLLFVKPSADLGLSNVPINLSGERIVDSRAISARVMYPPLTTESDVLVARNSAVSIKGNQPEIEFSEGSALLFSCDKTKVSPNAAANLISFSPLNGDSLTFSTTSVFGESQGETTDSSRYFLALTITRSRQSIMLDRLTCR